MSAAQTGPAIFCLHDLTFKYKLVALDPALHPTCSTVAPIEYMQAVIDGLDATTERFAPPLIFNPLFQCYYSLYP